MEEAGHWGVTFKVIPRAPCLSHTSLHHEVKKPWDLCSH